MKIQFVRDVFESGVRIHAQDDIAERDASTERWIRRGAAVGITVEAVAVPEQDQPDTPKRNYKRRTG